MISPLHFWFLSFAVFLAAFVLILWKGRDLRFFFYFIFGSLVAFFVFDAPSVFCGFYGY